MYLELRLLSSKTYFTSFRNLSPWSLLNDKREKKFQITSRPSPVRPPPVAAREASVRPFLRTLQRRCPRPARPAGARPRHGEAGALPGGADPVTCGSGGHAHPGNATHDRPRPEKARVQVGRSGWAEREIPQDSDPGRLRQRPGPEGGPRARPNPRLRRRECGNSLPRSRTGRSSHDLTRTRLGAVPPPPQARPLRPCPPATEPLIAPRPSPSALRVLGSAIYKVRQKEPINAPRRYPFAFRSGRVPRPLKER